MSNISNEDNKNLYVCATKCPEFDSAYIPRCKGTDPNSKKCPCDRHPVWISLEECDK